MSLETNPALRRSVIYELYVRSHTPQGTFRAVEPDLPRIRALGTDILWLMPIHPIGEANRKGSMGCPYANRDYRTVNPEYGTLEDFLHLVDAIHDNGMKCIIDVVYNHTSPDATLVALHPEYYYRKPDGSRGNKVGDWTDVVDLDYAVPGLWDYQIESLCYWAQYVDGFRCDMAMLVPIEFWNETSLRLRRVKPDLFMLAEAEERNLFEEGAFDACYAWRMHHLMNDVAQQKVRVTALRDYIYADRNRYPQSAMRLVFTSNHDENSWNGSEFTRMGGAREIMAAFTFVVPRGLPLVYTGQEIGYDHSFAFFDRDPIPSYAANSFTDFYRRLAGLRHANPALAAGEAGGEMVEIRNNAEDCLMTFVREVKGNRVVAVMNLSPYAIHADYYTGIYAGMYTDAMTGVACELRGHVEEDMAPWSYRILTR